MDKDKIKSFASMVFADMAGAVTAGMGYLGTKTGLFRAMAGKGPMRAEEVARDGVTGFDLINRGQYDHRLAT